MKKAWTLAIEALSWYELKRVNLGSALRKASKQLRIRDKETYQHARNLTHNIVRRLNAIDKLLEQALHPQKLADHDIGIRSFLRLFTYEIFYGTRSLQKAYMIAEHATDLLGKKKLSRIGEALDLLIHQQLPWGEFNDYEKLAFTYFYPVWYVRHLNDSFGIDLTKEFLGHIEVPQYIRINTLKSSRNTVNQLYDLGIQLFKEPDIKNTYRVLEDNEELSKSKPYSFGEFIIEDKASILVGEIAAPKPGDTVLDVCAAPGVKTSHLAQLMDNQGTIYAVDFSRRRLKSFEIMMNRLGVTITMTIEGDARKNSALPRIMADLVLVDPPCTGTGTFNKDPSGKWRITPRSINTMTMIQGKILQNSSTRVKPGGTLVYSTCSIFLEENEGIVKTFLSENPDFQLVESSPRIGSPGLLGLDEAQRLYPHLDACNGFFVVKMLRIEGL